jgi:aspartate aminotransferase
MNPRVVAMPGSQIRALNAKKRPTSIDLGLGEPSLLPQQRFIDAATAWTAINGCKYTPNAGDAELRAKIAAHYAYPGMTSEANVCITVGSQEAVYVAINAMLDPAQDELLVVDPAFPAYAKVAQVAGLATRSVAMPAETGFAFDAARVVEAVGPATRMIVVCSPCNPSGRIATTAELQKLADGLLARGGPPIWVMHDELYRELAFTPDFGQMAKLYPYTVAINSLSKSNALTGMRLGWLIAPIEAMSVLIKLHGWAASTSSMFAQRVAHGIFDEPGALSEQLGWYGEQRANVIAALDQSGLRYVVPDGTFYAIVRPNIDADDDFALAERLIAEADVVAIPGSLFGASSRGWLRLSWVAPVPTVREGLRRIAAFR